MFCIQVTTFGKVQRFRIELIGFKASSVLPNCISDVKEEFLYRNDDKFNHSRKVVNFKSLMDFENIVFYAKHIKIALKLDQQKPQTQTRGIVQISKLNSKTLFAFTNRCRDGFESNSIKCFGFFRKGLLAEPMIKKKGRIERFLHCLTWFSQANQMLCSRHKFGFG